MAPAKRPKSWQSAFSWFQRPLGIFSARWQAPASFASSFVLDFDSISQHSPGFSCDSALQVTYIVRGSGRAQVVGADGKRVLEVTVKAGNLFIVPRFFVVSKIADPDGMDWFSIITTPNPIFTHLAGKTSVWKALSPEVLQAAFNVPAEVEQKFRSKRLAEEIFFPPPK